MKEKKGSRVTEESKFRFIMVASGYIILAALGACSNPKIEYRQRISINDDWRFYKYESAKEADHLIYDNRPSEYYYNDAQQADTRPEEALVAEASTEELKPYILPTANAFIADPANHHVRPDGNPGADFLFVQSGFDDSAWERLNLPHDWAIAGPFYEGVNAEVTGGMGRLPSPGVAWYRKKLEIPETDEGKSVFLDVDGAMSYAMVWLNGKLVGGWPFGYASWRLDLTPYLNYGGENQLAIRLDNPPESSRWYPGGGIYRNMWLVKTDPVHVAQWGTFITTPKVSKEKATVDLQLRIENDSDSEVTVTAETEIFEIDTDDNITGFMVAAFEDLELTIPAKGTENAGTSLEIEKPKLWGPLPTQTPNRYLAITTLIKEGEPVDQYKTFFGIRNVEYDAEQGVIVNGEHIYIQGANQHHDLGAVGAAFNERAAERQLEILREAGVNSIRMAHNPPAPELLHLTDKMGFLVMDESFDVWERRKAPLDFHRIFPDWHEADLRAIVRRDRNHPSVIMWSTGNEVGEQYTGQDGADLALKLRKIVEEEDPTRPTTASMNFAKPPMEFPDPVEVISLNYQGEGIRDEGEYAHLRDKGITTPPLYPSFKKTYPDRVIISSENAAAVSSRGTYIFPVVDAISSPVSPGKGGNPETAYVSSYELYTADFGSSADKVFRSLDQHSYVAGGYVWSGFDYLGEPTPYYSSRSSYFGIVDLAGFKKDRFYIYQAKWRPELPMVHIFPHWNWPDRVGKVTPVHVATSGDEVELFLNGKSLGRKKKGEFEYRLRWDDVMYEPGKLKAVAYKNGEIWVEEIIQTTGEPVSIVMEADRSTITADGKDLSFITVQVTDEEGNPVPDATNLISFSIAGPGEIVATDNGDPTDFTEFPSLKRKLFSGKALVIVRSEAGNSGSVTVKAESDQLGGTEIKIQTAMDN